MVLIYKDIEVPLKESESDRIKEWILQKISGVTCEEVYPRFTDYLHRVGALHITYSDRPTWVWLRAFLE